MIQNTNDIYELIKSPLYAVSPASTYHHYDIYNTSIPSDWMRVVFRDNYMEICKYKDRGSEYYENIITTIPIDNKPSDACYNEKDNLVYVTSQNARAIYV